VLVETTAKMIEAFPDNVHRLTQQAYCCELAVDAASYMAHWHNGVLAHSVNGTGMGLTDAV